jgi:Zn-dependent metalloprotease
MAQPSVRKLQQTLQTADPSISPAIIINADRKEQASLLLSAKTGIPINNVGNWLNTNLGLRRGKDSLVLRGESLTYHDLDVRKLQQMYKGIKVEHGIVNATARNGNTTMIQLEFYPVDDNFNTTPSLPMVKARQLAIWQVGATQYAWDEAPGQYPLPAGELVIMADFINGGNMVLAWKFEIYAIKPLSKAYVYVNATDGNIVLVDNIIKHTNVIGGADTRYSGRQNIVTDFVAGAPAGSQYRLRETRDGHAMATLNYRFQNESVAANNAAVDFTDNDNNWQTNEYGSTAPNAYNQMDDAALEAHFNMEIVNDYWRDVHARNSWDGHNSPILSLVHVTQNGALMDNAYWNGRAMYFGDGNPNIGDRPQTSIDLCGHELGHAVCETTAGLVYRWESGAINEGFSDIWGACITNYLLGKYPAISGNKKVWRLFEETFNPAKINPGLRDMANPSIFGDPGTYKDANWQPATFDVCPVPNGNSGGNDACGVHTNSGVLNHWFYILTHGDTSSNSFGVPYALAGIGFGKSEAIAYLTEQNLTPNAGYKTTRNVSVNAAVTLYGEGVEAEAVRNAWLAVGVDTAVFNMSNTSVFLTNSFSTIALGKNGCIWAGTTTAADNSSKGLYRYDGKKWQMATVLLNNAIQGMMADKNGGIWIAQSGRTGAQAITGGVNYFPDSSFSSNQFYSASDGTVSRNSRSIFVDLSTTTAAGKPSVWVASLAQITAGVSSNGVVCTGLNAATPYFTKQQKGIDQTQGVGGAQTIGGNATEVWAFASGNYGRSQIIRYNTATKDSIGAYDSANVPILTKTFQTKSIYMDVLGNKWLGMQTNGLVVQDKTGAWHKIDTTVFKTILPYGTIINNNAITGDGKGLVYIGTTNGLVFYNGGPIDSVSSFRRFTTVHGLPGNNIRGIALDSVRFKLLLATDSGIVFFDQVCVGRTNCWNQRPSAGVISTTISAGNWSDPSIWSSNQVPDETTDVVIVSTVTVDVNGICNSLKLNAPGVVNVLAGKNLTIVNPQPDPIQTGQKIKAANTNSTAAPVKK